jgi:hypothetical protein
MQQFRAKNLAMIKTCLVAVLSYLANQKVEPGLVTKVNHAHYHRGGQSAPRHGSLPGFWRQGLACLLLFGLDLRLRTADTVDTT